MPGGAQPAGAAQGQAHQVDRGAKGAVAGRLVGGVGGHTLGAAGEGGREGRGRWCKSRGQLARRESSGYKGGPPHSQPPRQLCSTARPALLGGTHARTPHHVEKATELGPALLGPPEASALVPLPTLQAVAAVAARAGASQGCRGGTRAAALGNRIWPGCCLHLNPCRFPLFALTRCWYTALVPPGPCRAKPEWAGAAEVESPDGWHRCLLLSCSLLTCSAVLAHPGGPARSVPELPSPVQVQAPVGAAPVHEHAKLAGKARAHVVLQGALEVPAVE